MSLFAVLHKKHNLMVDGHEYSYDFVCKALAAAMSTAEPVSVTVKPLEWEEIHQQRCDEDPTTEIVGFEAASGFGTYYVITVQASSFELTDLNYNDTHFETEEGAKAAAQADYETRILAALSHVQAPAPVAGIPTSLSPQIDEAMVERGMMRDTATATARNCIDTINALSEALEPFAKEPPHGMGDDSWPICENNDFTYGDLRAARAAIAAIGGTKP